MPDGIRILVIEDHAADSEVVRVLLASADEAEFHVENVSALEDGLERIAHGGLDLVLLGLRLSDGGGLGALEVVARAAPELPVVVMTGLDDRAIGLEAVRLGAQDYLIKGRATAASLARIVLYAIERKRAEEALRRNEERYRLLFNSINDAVFVHGLSDDNRPGQFTEVNVVACERLGYSREELLQMSPADIDGPEGAAVVPEMMARLRAERQAVWEGIHVAKDGRSIPVEISNHLFVLEGHLTILSTVRDITERRRAEEIADRSLGQIRAALEGTILAMSRTVETRDPYTAGHQRRVADLARAIARGLGLSASRVEGLYLASLVHDVGKIGLPAEILSKPSKLSATEFQLIQSHAAVGAEIIGDIDFPWPIAQMVRQHHERLDGSGYPDRLAGDAILLESRILAVADVVEAMVSDRPYRPGLGIDAALSEVMFGAGRRYDADVVDACVRLVRESGWTFG